MADQHRPPVRVSNCPRATVVIPVGHAGELLEQQVSAVLGQQVPFPFDVVVSCNIADRRACAVIEGLPDAMGDPRLRVVAANERRNAAYARNIGADNSTSDVLAFCDSDDLVAPGWLAALEAPVADDVAVGGYLDELRFAVPKQQGWRPPITPGTLPTFLGVPYAVSSNMAITRATFRRAGGFDEDLVRCEDIALSWRLRGMGVKLTFAPGAVVHYRHRTGVRELVKQHYLYGRGMSQVLHRYGLPHDGGSERLSGLSALRPNNQAVEHATFVGTVVRRGSIAAGRVVGLADEHRRHSVERQAR
jgi:cellulose synthase/poly-beta-1,6-N-acetylglucosamine synthase-like glycosyltransferase